MEGLPKKVVFAIPTITRPFKQTVEALKASVPLIEEAGWEHGMVPEIGNPYISAARANMLRKALDAKATVVIFIDHDMSWEPRDLLTLLETEGDVVAGTYRFKKDEEQYMGVVVTGPDGRIVGRESDGAVSAEWTPAGFLKVTRAAVNRYMEAYPELCYGERCNPHVDLFQHGAYKNGWWGEDAAFGRRWKECGGDIWIVPDLNLTHHTADKDYPGNFHQYLMKQPGGVNSDLPFPTQPEQEKLAKLKALLERIPNNRQ